MPLKYLLIYLSVDTMFSSKFKARVKKINLIIVVTLGIIMFFELVPATSKNHLLIFLDRIPGYRIIFSPQHPRIDLFNYCITQLTVCHMVCFNLCLKQTLHIQGFRSCRICRQMSHHQFQCMHAYIVKKDDALADMPLLASVLVYNNTNIGYYGEK